MYVCNFAHMRTLPSPKFMETSLQSDPMGDKIGPKTNFSSILAFKVNTSLVLKRHPLTACNAKPQATPHCLQNPKWPTAYFAYVVKGDEGLVKHQNSYMIKNVFEVCKNNT